MKTRLLMLLSENGLTAFIPESAPVEFANTPAGHADFLRWLPAALSEASLLIDLPAEEFRRESAPHLSGQRHRALLQRKLDVFFRGLTFRLAERQSRQAENRRDDYLLFSALQNPDPLQSWLEVMQSARIPLRGIYSLARLGSHLLGKTAAPHVLLVSWQSASGLRQSYFHDRQLVFSRLTRGIGRDGFIDAICADMPDTCRYLISAGLLSDGTALQIRVVGQESDLRELRKRLPDTPDRHYRYLTLESLQRHFRIGKTPDNSDATSVWLAILAQHPPAASYAQPVYTRPYRLRRIGEHLKHAGMATLALSFLCTGLFYWKAAQQNKETQSLQPLDIGVQREIIALETKLSGLQTSPAEMRTTVEWARRLEQANLNPRAFLLPISRIFDRHPDIMLDELAWQAATDVSPGSVRISVECHIEGFDDDPRTAQAQFSRFRADLAEAMQTVKTLRLPAGSNPEDSLDSLERDIPASNHFLLEMTWQRPG